MKRFARSLGCIPFILLGACSDGSDSVVVIRTPVEAPPLDCDPIAPSYCGFPYPNDYWTVPDGSTPTGKRLALPEVIMPATIDGRRSNPGAFNEMDGFSPGLAAMTHLPGATGTGLAAPASIGDSLLPSSPTVLVNAQTGEWVPHWVDIDEYAVQGKLRSDVGERRPSFVIARDIDALRDEQAFMLRPAVRLEDATRYLVAVRHTVDEQGDALAPSESFRALRDDEYIDDALVESRRPHFEDIFARLQQAGVTRGDLQIAWDFTTASRHNNTHAMVHLRDDALAKNPNGTSYSVAPQDYDLADGMACALEITFDMPLYLTQGETGGLLNIGGNGLPTQNGTFPYAALLIVPISAQTEAAPLVAVGHGQLGTREQVLGYQQIVASQNLGFFALDWTGFAAEDVGTVVGALTSGDLSQFRTVPERMQQGFLNFLIAMRTLSVEAKGGPATALNEALNAYCGGAMLDGNKRHYFGGSQGGILGASLMALSTDIERGLLAVPGQSYNLLLNRSVNFDPFAEPLYALYDWNALDMQLNLALIQGLWDRAEPTGYSKYIRSNTLPGTPSHEVFIQVSKSDHQVTNLGAHIMARTIGGVVNLAPTVRDVYGLEVVNGAHVGSAMIEIDFGNPDAPVTNIPPWADESPDPHGRATELRSLGENLRRFYDTGIAENTCDGPCDSDDLDF